MKFQDIVYYGRLLDTWTEDMEDWRALGTLDCLRAGAAVEREKRAKGLRRTRRRPSLKKVRQGQAGRKGTLENNTEPYGILNYLFVHGPSFLGCWEGHTRASICAGLTSVDSSVWKLLPGACDELIERKVHSMEILVAYSLALVGACRLVTSCFHLFPHARRCRSTSSARQRSSSVLE